MQRPIGQLALALFLVTASTASAQTTAAGGGTPWTLPPAATLTAAVLTTQAPTARPGRRRPPAYPGGLQLRGFGVVAQNWLAAGSTFQAVLGSSQATEFGGGVSVTEGSYFVDVSARWFARDGERVFVRNGQVFPLGIDTSVTMTPLDVTVGYRLRPFGRLRPYLGGGYTRLRYEETADFAGSGEDVSESFNGFHVVGGGEWRFGRLVGVATEVAWTRVANAIGDGGVSQAFGEDDLGGTSVRLKLVIGR